VITVAEAKKMMDGVVIPLATIFKEDGSLDADATGENVEWIIDQGATQGNTVFIAVGSGGDFTVMSTEERKQAIKAIADANRGRIPTFASVQSTDIRTTIELCQHCEEVGIDIVQMSSAYYYDVTPGDIIAWVKEVAKHTNVGFAAYSHWYSGSKYDMTMDVAEGILEVPNTVAVKWGSPNIRNYLEGIKYFVPRAAVVNNGPLAIYGHQLGVKAWVSHIPNFYPQMLEDPRADEGRRLRGGPASLRRVQRPVRQAYRASQGHDRRRGRLRQALDGRSRPALRPVPSPVARRRGDA